MRIFSFVATQALLLGLEAHWSWAQSCKYGELSACDPGMFCVYIDKGKTECQIQFKQPIAAIIFPFEKNTIAKCDQGVLSPPGNSHNWLNTAFAIDLQSDRSKLDVLVFAGIAGKVIVQDGCKTTNDQCGLGFGNAVKILNDNGFMVFYAHLKQVLVKTGEAVQLGQKIGVEGMTGWTGKDNRHLHLSVHHDWRPSGFDYWKHEGYLPPSVPFNLKGCAGTCNAGCLETEIDVRSLVCQRTSPDAKPTGKARRYCGGRARGPDQYSSVGHRKSDKH